MDEGAIDEAASTPSPFRATSPGGTTHRWSGSEITFRDSAGSELVYLQAQRDFHAVTKNDGVAVVGNNDATRVGADRLAQIGNSEQLEIAQNQTTRIGAAQKTTVQNDIDVESVGGSERHVVAEHFFVSAKEIGLTAAEQIVLHVGSSLIAIRPDCIVIQAPHVFVSPGAAAVAQMIDHGITPETPQQREAREASEAAARERREQVGVRPYDPAARPQSRADEARAAINRSQQLASGSRLPPEVEREHFDDMLRSRGFNDTERREAIDQWLRDNPRRQGR